MKKIRILFMPLVYSTNLNAQSLNAREIALRLDASRFECSLFYVHKPDERLLHHSHIKLLPLRAHLRTVTILKEMLCAYDIVAYVDYSPATYLFVHSPRLLRRNTKTVMHVEAPSSLTGEEAFLYKFLYRGIVPMCDFHTCITESTAQDFKSIFDREVFSILPVGVDHRRFAAERKIKGDSLTVLFVGTLTERKRPLLVVEAASYFPDVKFRIIGPDRDGYEYSIRRRMAELNIKNVIVEGAKSQEFIAGAMRESDVFLLPSLLEGLPKVTLEAAASGLPCIVFSNYKTPSVVDGVTGFQVDTIDQMIEKLGLLLKNAQLRYTMGSAGRKLAEEFSWDHVALLWQDTYLRIASAEM